MKTSYISQTLVMLFIAFTASAQQGINYKAMIKDANGDALANKTVTVQFTILENGTTDVFQESHNPTTDANGIIIINIGEGTLTSGDFNTIDWGSNPHFLKTEINSGDGLTDMGTTEFKAVPYALYAETAGNSINTIGLNAGDLLMYDGNNIVSATFRLYYQDNDLDGYGLTNDFVFSHVQPDGFALIGTDCDDTNDNINPEIEEICDGIDNNCDGNIDEGFDSDGDGYTICQGDCNDNDADVYPGALEHCDGQDNDCDGITDPNCVDDVFEPNNDIDSATPIGSNDYVNAIGIACDVDWLKWTYIPDPIFYSPTIEIRCPDGPELVFSVYDSNGDILLRQNGTPYPPLKVIYLSLNLLTEPTDFYFKVESIENYYCKEYRISIFQEY